MKNLSLDPIFIPVDSDVEQRLALVRGNINGSSLRHAITDAPFNEAYDFIRAASHELAEAGRTAEAIETITDFDALAERFADESPEMLNIHAALMQTRVALLIYSGDTEQALTTAAKALNLLSQHARRKDEPFLAILASLLYDISLVHNAGGQHRQAEREIEKSVKIFSRLARVNPARYGSARILAVNASTAVFRSRQKQAETLAELHASVNDYLREVNEGIEDAGLRLVDSLTLEGRTLMKMSRQREAVQYFTRALRYLTRLEPEFSEKQLSLSVDLGEALLAQKTTREKGIHLLNTMLYKASKLSDDTEHRRIVDILFHARNSDRDIFAFWHKLFPR